jgi:hypothetical protein
VVALAQRCYDEELARRRLAPRHTVVRPLDRLEDSEDPEAIPGSAARTAQNGWMTDPFTLC